MTLEKIYQPHELEKKWYQQWENAGLFQPQKAEQTYCIMLPPPNVTGTLHMGHAFQDTIMDVLIRYHRMEGEQTLWQGGTDHAGIATQMVVERQLANQGICKQDLGREAFIDKIWEWKAQSGSTISQQMRRLGASLDWSRERFTLDEGLSQAVKETFIRLYEEGLIYRGQRLVNWDPKLHTAVSDLEVLTTEEAGQLWYIRYPLTDQSGYVVVATTRPETLLGDVAVAVHPADPRYQQLIGQTVKLPLCERHIPIIADEFVMSEFGTGCVKITPAHDFTDHEIGKKHQLNMLNIFTIDAHINQNAPLAYQGLDRFKAREQIVKELEQLGLLDKVEPYQIKIPRGDRSGEILEPFLTYQWFVRAQPLAQKAIAAVATGKIKFYPENWTKTYFEWMHNLQDWCISRQIWWGHRIPAWYDDEQNIYVGKSEEEIRRKFNLNSNKSLNQDPDVLDTWFSSALWPFSTLGWPQQSADLKKYYPTNVLVTGFDIIFFWVARMIMLGLKFMDEVPFKEVFVHGLIQDAHGQKMSKSKGNVLDPLDLIDGIDLEKLVAKRTLGLMQPAMAKQIENNTRKEYPEGIPSFGTDPLRFTFCALASNGRHLRFDLARVAGYRNFCNKLWNAARFVLMNVADKSLRVDIEHKFSLYDQWICSHWQKVKAQIHEHIATYRFDLLANTLYDFIWNHYCDWYLEFSKPVLQNQEQTAQQDSTRFMLVAILEEILRAIHPLMPFISEEIWQKLKKILAKDYFEKDTSFIMLQPYPHPEKKRCNEEAELHVQWIQSFIMQIRTLRGEMNLSPAKSIGVLCRHGTQAMRQVITLNLPSIQSLAKISHLDWLKTEAAFPISATALVEDLEIFIPLAGLIDKTAESKRLAKEIDKLNKEITSCQYKLNNAAYLGKAPSEVVEKERDRLLGAQRALHKLSEHLAKINAL